jgi:DNA-binding NtrC family response regulator
MQRPRRRIPASSCTWGSKQYARVRPHPNESHPVFPIRAGVNVSDSTYKSRVLIVDDEQNIANTLAMVFKIKGHEALAVYSAESAVEAIETFEPDVVLSDVIMGKMTGVDLAIYLSRARPDCKVILFSGQTATADVLAEASRKGHDFRLLAKPIHPEKLLEEINGLR